MAYADIEALLIPWLAARITGRVLTDMPATIAGAVVQVTKYAGADLVPSIDRSSVDIDCYAPSRQQAHDLAEQVRDLVRFTLPGSVLSGKKICVTSTILAPSWRPYENTTVRRFGATYSIIAQSHA